MMFFFFNDPATSEGYTYGHPLSLRDALPICSSRGRWRRGPRGEGGGEALRRSSRCVYRRTMEIASPLPGTEPPRDCPRCPRLVALRAECRTYHPDWRSEEHTSELQSLMRRS